MNVEGGLFGPEPQPHLAHKESIMSRWSLSLAVVALMSVCVVVPSVAQDIDAATLTH